MLTVSQLYIYPIKSCAGIAVHSAQLTSRGLLHDRRWMLVDAAGRFITQREVPLLSLLQVTITDEGLWVQHKKNNVPGCFIPHILPPNANTIIVTVFDDSCKAKLAGKMIDAWFSHQLRMACHLVYMPDDSYRTVDEKYALANEITSFSDGYPTLLIGEASLQELNNRLANPLPMNRFRPNIVFNGGQPHEEDTLEEFAINEMIFYGVKLCARCVITTINQEDATKAKEPLITLAGYRKKNNKVYFGQNLLHQGTGSINIGDPLLVRKRKVGLLA